MRVLILGSGGREHALAIKLLEQAEVFVLPGNVGMALNPKIQCLAGSSLDFAHLEKMVQEFKIDLVIPGSEAPLFQGVVDYCISKKIPIVGPNQMAARLESSKAFSKRLMREFGIPTADFFVAQNILEAKTHLRSYYSKFYAKDGGVVIKASGPALGKGVFVCSDLDSALNCLKKIPDEEIVIERKLKGREISAFALVSGTDFIHLGMAKDYKRLADGDQGPNTGGMGSIVDSECFDLDLMQKIETQVYRPLLTQMAKIGCAYRGFLFAGLMIDAQGEFNILEFNVRLGDPETQVLLSLLEGDFLENLNQVAHGGPLVHLGRKRLNAVCVVMAANGYPGIDRDVKLGDEVYIDWDRCQKNASTQIYFAGIGKNSKGSLISSGGRVLNMVAIDQSLSIARHKAYDALKSVQLQGCTYRKDIGKLN